jgi:prepilin-type N-terminal cleavage/methylation domain-containing protein
MSNSIPKHFLRKSPETGFSLVELVIVCAIISIIAAISLASFANRDQAGRFQADVAARLRERRASAVRINALTEPTFLENFRQPPIGIDFTNLPTTAALVIEGQERTTFAPPANPGGNGTWNFVYQGRQLQIPSGWRIATAASDLSPISLIPLGTLTTSFSFTAAGKLDTLSLPVYTSNTNPNNENPFPTIYLTNGTTARAVAVHPSGLVELWNYDEATQKWTGFSDRQVTATPTPTPTPAATPTPAPAPCSIGVSPNPLLVPKNGSATITVTLWSNTDPGTVLAAASGAAKITVSPSSQNITGEQSATFTVHVMTSNGSVNFSSPCGSTNLSVKTF